MDFIILIFLFFFFATLLLMLVVVFFGGKQLVARRPPDAPDSPSNYGMLYEDVSFASRYKATLRGWWIPTAAAPLGTIIFCHGQNGSMEGDLPMAVPFHKAGYNLLLFNMRAHGTSDGNKITFGVFEKEDVLGAIDYIRAEKGVDKVALLGMSMGAGVALIAASLSTHVSVLILDGVFSKFTLLVERAIGQQFPKWFAQIVSNLMIIGATLRTNTRMFQVSPALWARHLKGVPVLFIHAENDPFVTLSEVQSLAADLEAPHKIWVAPGCKHREAFKKYPEEYTQHVLEWLSAHSGQQSASD